MNADDWKKHPNYSIDPYTEVPPALLNSVHINCYGRKECLVTDFDPQRVNPASYTMCLLGTLYWWERKRKRLVRQEQSITEEATVTLPRNSISYLLTAQEFRLPQYIAARFNLHIRHVHKGILLGTGPLVDPGFAGPLLIPLHNLTDNDYNIPGGNPIIWVEFTKLSPLPYWARDVADIGQCPPAGFEIFLDRKYNLRADDYFKKALDLSASALRHKEGVQSAFKGAMDDARNAARKANKTSNWVRYIGVGAGVAVVIGALTLTMQAVSLISEANQVQASTKALIENLKAVPPVPSASPDKGDEDEAQATRQAKGQDSDAAASLDDSDPAGDAETIVRNAENPD